MRTSATNSTKISDETAGIAQTREDLASIERIAANAAAAIETLSASLDYADMDPETLGDVADILNAACTMQAAAHKACQGVSASAGHNDAHRSGPGKARQP